jgi:integrase
VARTEEATRQRPARQPDEADVPDELTVVHDTSLLALMSAVAEMLGAEGHRITITEARAFVGDHLVREGRKRASTLRREIGLWDHFDAYAAASGVTTIGEVNEQLVGDWIRSLTTRGGPAAPATQRLRRSVIRSLFRELRRYGVSVGDPSLDVAVASGRVQGHRALTDIEVERCRWAALATARATRQPAIWALAEAGASSAEVAGVRIRDLDLDSSRAWVEAASITDPRWIELSEWGVKQLALRVADVGPDPEVTVAYQGTRSLHSRNCSVDAGLEAIFRRAGIAEDPQVAPRSVTAWVGRRLLADTGRIEVMAARLGLRSLDQAAHLVALDWRRLTDRRS